MNTQTDCRLYIVEHAEHVPQLLAYAQAIGLRTAKCTDAEVLAALGRRGGAGEVVLEVATSGLDISRFLRAFRELVPSSPITCLTGFEGAHALLLARSGSWSHPGAGSPLDFAEALQLVRVCSPAPEAADTEASCSEMGDETRINRPDGR